MTFQTSAIAAIVALIFISAAVILGLGISGRIDTNSTPFIVSIMGMVTTVVVALLNVIRTDRVAEKVGHIETKTEAIERRINGEGPNASPHP